VDAREIETARSDGSAPNVRWHQHKDGSRVFVEGSVRALHESSGEVRGFLKIAQNVTDRMRAEEALKASERHPKLLVAELQHRVRNTLSVVRSIARRTAESSESLEDYVRHLDGRLASFARVQGAVTRNPDGRLDLAMLVGNELLSVAAREGDRVTHIEGPKVHLRPRAAETAALAFTSWPPTP
jgi:two-component system CheB/CheR fusion protein